MPSSVLQIGVRIQVVGLLIPKTNICCVVHDITKRIYFLPRWVLSRGKGTCSGGRPYGRYDGEPRFRSERNVADAKLERTSLSADVS